jgi:WD40 repeat protein
MKLVLKKRVDVGRVIGLAFARGARRLIVTCGDDQLLLDVATGKPVGKLPKGAHVAAVDDAGTLAAVHEDGKYVGKRYEWGVSLWDLAKGKKICALAKNNPDDNVAVEAIGPTRLLALRKKKSAYSFCVYDRRGAKLAEHPLGKVPLPFHAAMSPDEKRAAHAYFTGVAHLVDLESGKSQKLTGGALRIGRQHDKGITHLAFDAKGEHVMVHSAGSEKAHVWSVRTRKPVPGKWTSESPQDAFFRGDSLAVLFSGSQGATLKLFPLDGKGAPKVFTTGKGRTLFADLGDGKHVACAGYSGHDAWAEKGLSVFDLTTGKRVARAPEPKGMNALSALIAGPGFVAAGDLKSGVAIYAFA